MKRIVVLIDGTWNKEGTAGNTNVAKLDIGRRIAANAFIKVNAADGAAQHVHYHDGVGTEGDFFMRFLGGAIGLGLKQIIKECYGFVVVDFTAGDEIYIAGFSRGAYAARALAGLIGASGIQRQESAPTPSKLRGNTTTSSTRRYVANRKRGVQRTGKPSPTMRRSRRGERFTIRAR